MKMFNMADVIGILFILIITFIGYKRGFVKTAFGMLSFIIAMALSVALYKNIAFQLAENTAMDEWIYHTIMGQEEENSEVEAEEVEEEIQEEETQKGNALQNMLANLPENIKEKFGLEELQEQTKEVIAEKVTEVSLYLISFIAIYALARIVLSILCFVLDKIMKIPLLKQLNEILGLLLGMLQGLLEIYLVLAIITFFSSVFDMEAFVAYIKASAIIGTLYENNFIISLLF